MINYNYKNCTPLSFRFHLLPNLKARILPIYKNFLVNQMGTSLIVSKEEYELIVGFVEILYNLMDTKDVFNLNYDYNYYDNLSIDIHTFIPVFEMMQKMTDCMYPVIRKISLTQKERDSIITSFKVSNGDFLNRLLENTN